MSVTSWSLSLHPQPSKVFLNGHMGTFLTVCLLVRSLPFLNVWKSLFHLQLCKTISWVWMCRLSFSEHLNGVTPHVLTRILSRTSLRPLSHLLLFRVFSSLLLVLWFFSSSLVLSGWLWWALAWVLLGVLALHVHVQIFISPASLGLSVAPCSLFVQSMCSLYAASVAVSSISLTFSSAVSNLLLIPSSVFSPQA